MIKTTFVQTNYHGWGCLSLLPEQVQKLNAKNVLIIGDPILAKIGLIPKIEKSLSDLGINCIINTNVVAEPPLSIGEELVQFSRQHAIDLVIGIGGGSALDLAKLVAALTPQTGKVEDYLNLTGMLKIVEPSLPKIMLPTTSGTGSEVTNISVLSLENSKDVVVDDALLADIVIVDPEITISVPPRVTAATGIDALTHAIESYVSVLATPISEPLSLQAIKLIGRSLLQAVNNGEDKQARTDMSYGSYLAGLAFFNAGCTAVHALAYPLGGQFHIAHGESNAVLLPYVMGYIRHSCEQKLKDIYQALGYDAQNLTAEEASIKCIKVLQQLVASVGIPNTLKEFNIPSSAIPALTDAAILQKRLLSRSPLALQKADIEKIYQASFNGEKFC